MKSVTYSDPAQQRREEYSLLQQATQQLETIAGRSAPIVAAEWDLKEDESGRPVYTLTLSDFAGSVQANFAPEVLNSPTQLRYRLRRLVGDLLQVRSDKQLREILESSGGPEVGLKK